MPGYANTLENKIRETEQELGTIQDRLKDGKELAESQSEEKRLEKELVNLEQNLASLKRDLDKLDNDITETEQHIEITEQELAGSRRTGGTKDAL